MILRQKNRSSTLALILLVFTFPLSGCNDVTPPSIPSATVAQSKPTQTRAPVIILAMLDQSGSTNWTRTPKMSIDDLKLFKDLLVNYGGEIAWGLIRDESNRGFVRLSFPVPPIKPSQPTFGDDIDELDKQDDIDEYNRLDGQWKNEMENRKANIERQFNGFLETIKPLMDAPSKGATDIWGAIQRADVMLSENPAAWSQEPHRYLLLVSDGEDTIRKKPVSMKSKAQTILINGEGRRGSLEKLNSLECFESVRAGVEFIVAKEDKDNGFR